MKKLIYSSLFAMLLLCSWQNEAKAQNDDKIYAFTAIDSPPTYPGGITAFYKFLSANIKYPEAAVKENVQGNVFLSFIVEKDGSLNDVQIDHKLLGAGTDEEAVRVVKMTKNWNPGKVKGKAVRVKYNIPVKFAIAGVKPKPKTARPIKGSKEPVDENTIYNFVSLDNPPAYQGGIAAFYKFLTDNIKYPEKAIANKVQGTVFVSFVVEKDGNLSDLKIERKLGSGTDEEAIRILKLTKNWKPAMLNGKPVRANYAIPVAFKLKED